MTREGRHIIGRTLGASTVLLSLLSAMSAGRADAGVTSARAGATRDSHAGLVRPGHAARSSVAALIAVALRGDIYTVPVGDGSPRRLTSYGLNSAPALSPHESLVAYLSTSKRFTDQYGNATTHGVWIVPVDGRSDGSSAYKITATTPKVDRGGLSWSPDGQRLAYYEGASVVVSDDRGGHRTVVLRLGQPFGAPFSLTGAGPIAWSPDSRRIALALPPAGHDVPRELRVATADVYKGTTATSTIRFDPGALGQIRGRPSSYPSGQGLAWAPDGRHFLVETLVAGEGNGLTGVWQAAQSGGVASRLIGSSVLAPAREEAATHIELSLDRTRLLADPADRIWVAAADGSSGRYVTPILPRGCVVAQETWLNDGAGIAYVTVCLTGRNAASGPIRSIIRATLYTMVPAGARPRALLHVDDTRPDALQLTPLSYRCLECGA